MKLVFATILLCHAFFALSQGSCTGSTEGAVFNANRIKTFFSQGGHKMFNREENGDGFQVPYPPPVSFSGRSTIESGGVWIGGLSAGGRHLAATRYAGSVERDYYTGPLDPDALPYTGLCEKFDSVWNVFREDILRHTQDFEADGKIDDTVHSIFGWPAENNPFFREFNGFDLPLHHQGGWAHFADLNANGVYEPHLGEYPAARLQGQEVDPDQIMWMVFHDQGPHGLTYGQPFGLEIQLTVFGFYCQDQPWLNHSIFNSYKLINQANVRYDSVYFGQFHDFEIGCGVDNYVGCDSSRNSIFAYNALRYDGEGDEFCTMSHDGYQTPPPVQSVTYLSHPLHSFVTESGDEQAMGPSQYAYVLEGRWRDGTPIRKGGSGYHADTLLPVTRYLFHGDLRDSSSWNELAVQSPFHEAMTVSSVFLGTLLPHQNQVVECVYSFHQDTAGTYADQFDLMYAQLDQVTDVLSNLEQVCQPFPSCLTDDCVWPGDFNHDGIADYRDLLFWGISDGKTGAKRNGLVNWRGHAAEDWKQVWPNGLNAKHQDGDGNGDVNAADLYYTLLHYHYTTPYYLDEDMYTSGPELIISSDPMSMQGIIPEFTVAAGSAIEGVYGLAFELEFDTSLFAYAPVWHQSPIDTPRVVYQGVDHLFSFYPGQVYGNLQYAFVRLSGDHFTIPDGFELMHFPSGLRLKDPYALPFLPEYFAFRLKNITAMNKQGQIVKCGSMPYFLSNPKLTSIYAVDDFQIKGFPNPVSSFLYVELPQHGEAAILDIAGRRVHAVNVQEGLNRLDVSALPVGVYQVVTGYPSSGFLFFKL